MRKIYLAAILSSLVVLLGYAQGVPQGMNYQAVARDKSGNELINTQISLQISLYSPQSKGTYYTETHTVTTNQFGLFSLVIGEGTAQSGTFATIPWGSEEIWMSVGIQTAGQSDYTPLGSSKLYAVPYALYAGNLANSDTNANKLKSLSTGSGQCPCNGGITTLSVLYLGPGGVTIRVYNNSGLQNSGLIQTFTSVANGAVLTIHVPANIGTLQSETYFEYSAIPNPPAVTAVPTPCSSSYSVTNPASPGGTWGNISIISQTDQNGETCTACNVNGQWYIGGNAVLAACNTLGTLSNNDLVLISNNTPRMVVSASGDVTVNNNLNVNEGLNALGNVKLNESNGATTNNGPLTVANFSPTTLTGSLTTNGATLLNNTLTVGQATNLNGILNVNNQQPTDLSGNLTVNRATKLDSSLWVAGNTDLHGYLHVDEQASSVFTGTIQGYLNATFNDQVLVTDANLNSTSPSTGALVVAGGTGIGQALYVGGPTYLLGSLSVGGNTDLYGYLHVNNQQPTLLTGTLSDSLNATFFQHVTLPNAGLGSTTPYNGALVVAGGVGIGQNLNVEGASTFHGPVSFGSVVTFTDTVNSTNYTNGTIVDEGGAGIAENLNVNGAVGFNSTLSVIGHATLSNRLTVLGSSLFDSSVVINANLGGDHTTPGAYPLTVMGSSQGIRIQVNGSQNGIATFSNDYLQFVDASGTPRGSITGETQADLNNDFTYLATQSLYSFNEARALYEFNTATQFTAFVGKVVTSIWGWLSNKTEDVAITAIQTEEAVNTEIGDDAATSPCVGLGVCETVPPPSDIAAGVANVVEDGVIDGMEADEEAVASASAATNTASVTAASVNASLASGNLAAATIALAKFNAQYIGHLPGVYLNSGNGDYAEWLPKANPNEKIYQGDIVGVKGGLISKATEGAEKLMVVSTMPIVLGNAPPKDKESNFEKVAFIGQVQIKVFGKVEPGDYIIASGKNDGFGLAKHADDMTAQDYQQIVGIAWEGAKATGMNYVNTAVGLNTNDFAKLAVKQDAKIKAQDDEINTLKNQIAQTNAALAKLVPGFNAAVNGGTNTPTAVAAVSANTPVAYASASTPGSKRYLEVTREEFDKGFDIAMERIKKRGLDPEKVPYLKKLEDPNYREEAFAKFQELWAKEVEKRKAIDAQLPKKF